MKAKLISLWVALFTIALSAQAQITLQDPVITNSYMKFTGENWTNNYRFTLDTYEIADRGPQFQLTVEPIEASKTAQFTTSDLSDPNYWEPMFRSYTKQLAGEEMTAQDNVKRLYVKNVALLPKQFAYYKELTIIGIEAVGDYTIPDACFSGCPKLETIDCNVAGTLTLGSYIVDTQPEFTVKAYTEQGANAWNEYKQKTGANFSVVTSLVEENVYTVCGSSAIFGPGPEGWGWDPADTDNDMTTIDASNYQLVKKNVALESGTTYEYKVVQNHSWEVNWGIGGQDGKNFTFTVPASGNYNVTFTFNLESGNCTADAVGTSAPEPLSQVPNGDFAEWEERSLPAELGGGSYTSPAGYWDTFNILAPGCVTKTEGRTDGSSAALLESKTVDMSVAGMPGESVTTSLLVTDRFLSKMTGSEYEQGVPSDGIPARYLTFWYKYQPVAGDVAQVFIQFNEDLIIKKGVTRTMKFRKKITEAAADWTFGYIDLSEDEYGISLSNLGWSIRAFYIDITSSASSMSSSTEGKGASAPGSKLWITELQFANEATAIHDVLSDRTKNPSPVYNLSGQLVDKAYKGIVIVNGRKVHF